ncbi:hypothetical protein FA15DRAFT_596894 [Coprinopsis marcescibilis]|uniref:lytic cellulose monooxygenase (C4-dehydrogenating) n=1 Tax=Coprinopsis marcescibilis TaxID=230819 RepID=A0A5C3KNR7_COPMA|nr:hypothetical protein FA15DRAFT_596894 [Coprinopsis marcescibilis]
MALLRLSFAVLVCAVASAWAHYQFSELTIEGSATGPWLYVRKTDQYDRALRSGIGDPTKDINSLDLRCNNTQINMPSDTATVEAGQTIGFFSNMPAYHHGVHNVYMARAPGNVSEWDGSGEVWFKVHEVAPIVTPGSPIKFPAQNSHTIEFQLPKSLPSGDYLVRAENIALHLALTDGPEFYLSCGQIRVVNGGDGVPGPLVSIPGLYTGEASILEPAFRIDVYSSDPEPFTMPGPVSTCVISECMVANVFTSRM